jgi:hypothetical protein
VAYLDSGERCGCSCHPRLPDSDLHDYGFDCVCTRTPEERRRVFQQWLDVLPFYLCTVDPRPSAFKVDMKPQDAQ